jgi:hypothetical protein
MTLANILKHELPWIGLVSCNSSNGLNDIYDDNKIVFVYDFLTKVYDNVIKIEE